jgi:hypothetical protein
MAVAVPAYASVRGFPKREAAEDFYLLNKIAKIGPVIRLRHSAVRLRARTSARTPFGTGAAVVRALAGEPPRFHSPEAYAALGAFVARLDGFVAHADTDRFFAELGSMDETAAHAILEVLSELDAKAVLLGAAEEAKSEFQRRIRVHGFFDALRNLKILHRLRDAGIADVSVAEALRAPFSPASAPLGDGRDGHDPDYLVARTAFARSEQKSPMSVGPWS